MKVIVLTTSVFGVAGHHLPVLLAAKDIEVAAVIVSEGQVKNKKKHYYRKLKKMLRIGLFGAWNGIKMRKWYSEGLNEYCTIKDARQTCLENNIRFEMVPSTNSAQTQKIFRELDADIALSLGNGYISEKVFSIPKYGMLNIHHEILPDYQNAQSVIWQLYNGSANTGYTIHKIDRHIDTGEILLQETVPVVFEETLGKTVSHTLCKVFDKSAEGLKKVLSNFEYYNANAQPQGHGTKYTTPSFSQYRRIMKQFNRLRKN